MRARGAPEGVQGFPRGSGVSGGGSGGFPWVPESGPAGPGGAPGTGGGQSPPGLLRALRGLGGPRRPLTVSTSVLPRSVPPSTPGTPRGTPRDTRGPVPPGNLSPRDLRDPPNGHKGTCSPRGPAREDSRGPDPSSPLPRPPRSCPPGPGVQRDTPKGRDAAEGVGGSWLLHSLHVSPGLPRPSCCSHVSRKHQGWAGAEISTANEYACKGLDKLEEKLPILQQPPQQVVAGTRELVSSTVSGAVGLARGGVERTRSALSTGVSTVVGSRVGRLLATGVDAVLGKSEELVERYLPGMDEQPAGAEVASRERQRRRQSCFVRVGSLSAKLQQRALQRSLAELQRARHSAQRVLAQLHRIFELIEQGRQSLDGPLYGTQRHLHRMWLEWSQQDAVPMEESEVEARTLAMLRGLLRQLHAACTRLAASARSFPGSVQETAGHVRHGMEGVQASLSRVHSIRDLSDLVLEQSRETVTRAQLSIDELLEHMGQHAPLPWLVGPFAPALVEYPEDVPVEMAKWEGCITVGGTHHVPSPPRPCSQR
ncbi:perilipin-3 isoform X2 [Columba livia]|uniref:perilipin-3 isoform X2 n=1 Tax=Columba livia TaxID=8932 RepID=UPI0031BA9E5B